MISTELIQYVKDYTVETKQFSSCVVDIIVLNLINNKSVDIVYKRDKSFVFNEQLLDYVIYHTKNYELLNDLRTINAHKK